MFLKKWIDSVSISESMSCGIGGPSANELDFDSHLPLPQTIN